MTAVTLGCCGTAGAGHRQVTELRYLDGGGAALLVLALAEQAIGLHIIPGHWHGLHHVQTVAAAQTNHNQQQYKVKTVLCARTLG